MFKSLVAASVLSVASAYSGDGTFYGAGGAGSQGACMLQPGFNGVGITVAMNVEQYENGLACGKCVKITGPNEAASPADGRGMTPIVGPIYATVDNLCPECKYGSVDLGLGGDGRWPINWEFVDCKEARAAGSNMPNKGAGGRKLRGGAADVEVLEPGYMVTAQGIRLIEDVVAEQRQQQAKAVEGAEPPSAAAASDTGAP